MKIIDFKKYAVGFVMGLCFVSGYTFASGINGTIGELFEKVGENWFLDENIVGNRELNNNENFVVNSLTSNTNIKANTFLYNSDIRLKSDIKNISEKTSGILKLEGVEWNWISNGEKDYGFIAQDIEEIYPELVVTDENGYKSVKYLGLIPILVENIKEQNNFIKDLRERLYLLENNIN